MEVKKDSIFSPQSKRNLVVTASLAMALGMGVAPGIALADEVDAAPAITRIQTETVDTPIVAAVESPAVDAAPTIRRNGADTLVAESTSGTVTSWTVSDYGYGSTSGSTSGHSTTTYNTPGSYTYNTPGSYTYNTPGSYTYNTPGSYTTDTTHSTTTSNYIPVMVIGDPNGGETTSTDSTPYNGTVNVSLGKNDTVQQTTQTTDQTTEIKTDAKVDQNTTQRLEQQTLQKTEQSTVSPIIDQPVVSDATDVAKAELNDFIADAAVTSDFAEQLGAESVTIVGEPELKAIAEGVFEILKMPGLVVEKADPATTNESYWWCVYIDGVKTKIMDTVGNLAAGIDHFLWSPEGTVDSTTFEGDVVYAQDPGMTVVMTASSMLGVEAMAEPEQQQQGGFGFVVPDVVVDTNTVESDKDATDTVEPSVSMSGRIASYIPTQVATTPAVEAAAETVETLAVTADPTDATPVVAWGAAGVATLLFAALRRRNEA